MTLSFIVFYLFLVFFISSSNQTEDDQINCRTATQTFHNLTLYKLDTCAQCYDYIPEWAFRNKLILFQSGYLFDFKNKKLILSNEIVKLSSTFFHKSMASKWLQCCEEAETCCINQLNKTNKNESKYQCPPTWDGWSCWNNGAYSNELATMHCPTHIYWLSFNTPPCRGYVSKQCTINGTWFEQNNKEWSNYGGCARDDIYIRRSWYQITTHLISVASIIPALFIFNHYRQLSRINRIRVHKHLLSSLLIYSALMALLTLQMLSNSITSASSSVTTKIEEKSTSSLIQNTFGLNFTISSTKFYTMICIFISLAVKYFRSTSYLWMFNEAFYLHRLIKQAFTTPTLFPLLIIAYGIPFLTTSIYILCRITQLDINFAFLNFIYDLIIYNQDNQTNLLNDEFDKNYLDLNNQNLSLNNLKVSNENERVKNFLNFLDNNYEDQCWSLPSTIAWHEWIINAPNLLILLVNCVFLLSMIRQIYLKAESGAKQFQRTNFKTELNKSNCCKTNSLLFSRWSKHQSSFKNSNNSKDINFNKKSFMYLRNKVFFYKDKKIKNKLNKNDSLKIDLNNNEDNSENKIQLEYSNKSENSFVELNELANDENFFDKDKHIQIESINYNDKSEFSIEKNNKKINQNTEQIELIETNFSIKLNSEKIDKKKILVKTFVNKKPSLKRQLTRILNQKGFNDSVKINSEHGSVSHKKSIMMSLRAASFLLPLYGLHYLVFVYRLDTTVCWLSELYHYCSITLDGLQGMLVSILFCFATKEVQQVLKKSLMKTQHRRNQATNIIQN